MTSDRYVTTDTARKSSAYASGSAAASGTGKGSRRRSTQKQHTSIGTEENRRAKSQCTKSWKMGTKRLKLRFA